MTTQLLILITIISILDIVCFLIGVKVGSLIKGVEIPKVINTNPIFAFKEHRVNKMLEKEELERLKVLQTNLNNIENYDGTGNHQQEF